MYVCVCVCMYVSMYVCVCMYVCTVQTFNSCTSRPDVCKCLVVKALVDNNSKNKRSTQMTHIAFETKVRSVLKSHTHPCPGNCVATGRVVVNYARAALSFSAGIKCRHCIYACLYICMHVYMTEFLKNRID